VDLRVANAVSLATQGGACTTNIRQIYEYGVIIGKKSLTDDMNTTDEQHKKKSSKGGPTYNPTVR
jgi:hypothetical protein